VAVTTGHIFLDYYLYLFIYLTQAAKPIKSVHTHKNIRT